MALGIFGGSFDPPHLGHRRLAEAAVASLQLDTLYVVPAVRSPHKTETTARFADRLLLCEQTFSELGRVSVVDWESKRQPPSYTIDTVEFLLEQQPNQRVWLVLGQDQLSRIESWHRSQDLAKIVKLAVFARPGEHEASLPQQFEGQWLTWQETDVSSTQIRQALRQGNDVQPMLHPQALATILRLGLYGTSKG